MTANDLEKIKALLFLISDILFNSAKITAAWSYNRHFELKMPALMNEMNVKISNVNGKLSQKKIMHLMKNLFKLWVDKSLFDDRIVAGW